MSAAVSARPALEVADIIREHGEAFRARLGAVLSDVQRRALRDLAACRTAALGGHVERCLDCGHECIAYNSCRNRHCPKCQALTRARWLDQQAQHLLPVEYHHVVFTLPQEVAELALANQRVLYDALFQAASATLREVAANPKRLGAHKWACGVGFEDTLALIRKLRSKSGIHPATLRLVALVQCFWILGNRDTCDARRR